MTPDVSPSIFFSHIQVFSFFFFGYQKNAHCWYNQDELMEPNTEMKFYDSCTRLYKTEIFLKLIHRIHPARLFDLIFQWLL